MDHMGMAYRARMLVSEVSLEKSVAAILTEMAARRPNVLRHSLDTAYMAAQLLEVRGSHSSGYDLIRGALLHDCGELEIPVEVLVKPGRLTEDERRIVESHAGIGERMLRDAGFSEAVCAMALRHHEMIDGTGYPGGLKSGSIPDDCKLLAVCDVYTALTADRPHRKAFNMYEAADIMSGMPLGQALIMDMKKCDDI